MIQCYVRLADMCLLALGIVYVFGIIRTRAELRNAKA